MELVDEIMAITNLYVSYILASIRATNPELTYESIFDKEFLRVAEKAETEC